MIDPRIATGIAVDPETFDLYINHRDSVALYSGAGDPRRTRPRSKSTPARRLARRLLRRRDLEILRDTYEFIYVADSGEQHRQGLRPDRQPDDPGETINGANTAAGRFVSLEDSTLAIDQSNGHLFVVDDTQPGFEHPLAAVSEFNAEGVFRGELQYPPIFGQPTGITVNESLTPANGDVYVTSGNGSSAVVTPTTGVPESEMGSLLAFGPAGKRQGARASVPVPERAASRELRRGSPARAPARPN